MTSRAVSLSCFLVGTMLLGCNTQAGPGIACFDTGECATGVCADTVYGKFCMRTCEASMVTCEDGEACLQGETIATGGAGGMGAAGAGGSAGTGGVGGEATGTGLFVCLPGDLDVPDFEPAPLGQPCIYSVDCAERLICVCPVGLTCDPQNSESDSAQCTEICDPTMVNRCPFQQACVDLGNGRGFCDPNTSQLN